MRKPKQSTPAVEGPKTITVRPSIQTGDQTAVYYVNFAEMTFSASEFCLSAARVPTKPNPVQLEQAKAGTFTFDADVQLIIPPTVIPGLIRALTTVKENYEK